MEQRRAALSLLAIIVLASGCAHTDSDVSTDSGAVEVTKLDVTPGEIRSGSTVRIEMGVTNAGVLPADLIVDRGGDLNGDAILTDYCSDLFDVKEFDSYSSSEQSTQKSYDLEREEEVRLSWELQQSGDIGINGARCPMKFKVPFNYTVEAYRQLQILRNDDVGSAQLSYQSSEGPLKLLIETIGSSSEKEAPFFIEGDSVEVLIQLVNQEKPEEAKYSGAVEVEAPDVTTPNSGDEFRLGSCDYGGENDTLTLYEGESQVIRCPANYSLNDPSLTGEVRAKTNYTFIKNVGTREVQVKYDGR